MKGKDLGKVMLTPEGSWVATRSYERLSAVEHNGSGFISLRSSYGIEPGTDPSVWAMFVLGGKPDVTADADGNIYVDGEILTSILAQVKDAEQKRTTSETRRSENENARVVAEQKRVAAEESRVYSENLRINAETSRRSAENARNLAEKERAERDKLRDDKLESYYNAAMTQSIFVSQIRSEYEEIRNVSIGLISKMSAASRDHIEKVVIGKAIPAYGWERGMSYFNSTSEFVFKIKGRYDAQRNRIKIRIDDFVYDFLQLASHRFIAIACIPFGESSSDKTIHRRPMTNEPSTFTKDYIIVNEEGLRIRDNSPVVLLVKVAASGDPDEWQPNVITHRDEGPYPELRKINDIEGVSKYLRVQNGRIICDKMPNGEKSTIIKRKKCITRRCANGKRLRIKKFQGFRFPIGAEFYQLNDANTIKQLSKASHRHIHVIRRYACHKHRYVSRVYEEIAMR